MELTRRRRPAWNSRLALIISDAIGLSIATSVGLVAVVVVRLRRPHHLHLATHFAFLPVFIACMAMYGLYEVRQRRVALRGLHDVVDVVHALAVGGLCCLAVDAVVLRITGRAALAPEEVVALCLIGSATVPLGRAIVAAMGASSWLPPTRVAILGSGRVADAVKDRLNRYSSIEVVAQVDDNAGDQIGVEGLERLQDLAERNDIDRVIVAFSRLPTERTLDLLRRIVGSTPVSIVPRLFELVSWRSRVDEIYGLPMIEVAPAQRRVALSLKRAFDVIGSGIALLILLPLFVTIAVAIKVTSRGPVFFRQERTGRWGGSFMIYKFRTMIDQADRQRDTLVGNDGFGPLFKLRRDPRVTKVGVLLRRSSLDELPQLINVLKGDMALVGPRPFVVAESAKIEGWARKRFELRPGMTGLWQVSGRSELTHEDLRHLDYLYVTSWSLWWDLRILAQTPRSVFHAFGAY